MCKFYPSRNPKDDSDFFFLFFQKKVKIKSIYPYN